MRRSFVKAVPAMMMVWMVSACATTSKPELPKVVQGGVQFTVSMPGAKSVAVGGSFNGWSAASHPMKPAGSDGCWSVVVPLPEGEHAFMYLVDEKRWVAPPLAEDFVTDGFGNTNGVVVVR